MEEEIQYPVSHTLFRQSSVEIPLSPSIPSDSDSEDDDQKDRPAAVGLIKKDVSSAKNDGESQATESSMNKLCERVENVALVKVMGESSGVKNKVADTDKGFESKPNISAENMEKPKTTVKPKSNVPKKNIPPTPIRSDSLQNKILANRAMAKERELQGRSEKIDQNDVKK